MTKKIVIFVTLLFFSFDLLAKIVPTNFSYKFCNHHQFNFFLIKVYDSYLCSNDKANFYPQQIFNSDFSLIIKYDMNFSKEELAKSSITEINRYYNISEIEQEKYYKILLNIFPNIVKNDIIEAKYSKDSKVIFYHNKLNIGQINDAKFSKIFLNIWLHPNSKYKQMIKDLFKK